MATDDNADTCITNDTSENNSNNDSSPLLPKNSSEMIKAVQQERAPTPSKIFDVVVKTNDSIVPVDTEHHYTTSNEQDTKQKQAWLTEVHEAIKPFKLSILANVDETIDTISSDDYHVTENVEPKIDRQPEWLAAVCSSIQKYKETTP